MKFSFNGINILRKFFKMFESKDNEVKSVKKETIQDIAIKLAEEQLVLLQSENGPLERTIFILGSKGVGKSTVVNKFFDRDEHLRPTLALEYSYGRRTNSSPQNQKQVLNFWELGSLENSEQLIEVPLRTHGLENFAAIIMLDLSQPQRVWFDLECAYTSLKNAATKIIKESNKEHYFFDKASSQLKRDHPDIETLDLMPFPIVVVGGKYDIFFEFDPKTKQHIGRCLRAFTHLVGGALLYYTSKNPKLSKILRDTISHLGFGSPSNPFRSHTTDFSDALSIWFGTDSWSKISDFGALNLQHIATTLIMEMPQRSSNEDQKNLPSNPTKDPGFRESVVDEMRSQKDEELLSIHKDTALRQKFENIEILS